MTTVKKKGNRLPSFKPEKNLRKENEGKRRMKGKKDDRTKINFKTVI